MSRYGYDTTKFYVCSCCLLAAANDDTSGHDDFCGDEPAPLSALSDYAGTLHAEGEEGDRGFSWRSCEGCGSQLGGDRYTLVGMVARTEHPIHAESVERLLND